MRPQLPSLVAAAGLAQQLPCGAVAVAAAAARLLSGVGSRRAAAAPFCSASSTDSTPPANQHAAAAADAAPNSSSSGTEDSLLLTEQQLAELFDDELQRRLSSPAAAAAAPAQAQEAAPEAAPPPPAAAGAPLQQHQQQQPSSSSSRGAWGTPPLPPAWSPLLSSDPWAPVPSRVHARQRLPQELLHLLQHAGVPHDTAAAALAAAAASTPCADADSRSSLTTTSADAAPAADSSQHSSTSVGGPGGASSRLGHRLFVPGGGAGGSAAHSRPSAADSTQQQQQQDVLAVLNRLRTQHLVRLLDECQAPSYGPKPVLLQRIQQLLAEQQQQPEGRPAHTERAHDSTPSSGHANLGHDGPQQQLPVDLVQLLLSGSLEGVQAAAAQQQLLDAVLDAQQAAGWLLAARAQDVCIIDTRAQAGLHRHIIVATGLNQRHTRALADAVAWQLRQAAKALLLSSCHDHQQQQHEQLSSPAGALDDKRLLPQLAVLGEAASDWCVLDAGRLVVHVLTARARRFYALEVLWAPPGVLTRVEPPAAGGDGAAVVHTLDTIGAPTAGAAAARA